jgi:hypothetical protein
MVKGAELVDLDGDKDEDLVLALEWGGIVAFLNQGKSFVKQVLFGTKGWWNFVKALDVDNDGDLDLLAGNQGENSRLNPGSDKPVRMYYHDFDGNGLNEQFITFYLKGEEIPFAGKAELEKQMPGLKKKFLYAEDFAQAGIDQIIDRSVLNKATVFSAESFSSMILINEGKLKFSARPLPYRAQLTCYKDALVTDLNGDGWLDVLLGGNYYGEAITLGRSDADRGTMLINRQGEFEALSLGGVQLRSEVRALARVKMGMQEAFLFARNNDTAMLLRRRDP